MTKQQKGLIVLAVGAAAIGWWVWRSRRMSGTVSGTGTSTTGSLDVLRNTLSRTNTIDDPSIVNLRGAAGGPASRRACPSPGSSRWIKTVTGPNYGLCVTHAQFARWTALPGDIQERATAETVALALGISQSVS